MCLFDSPLTGVWSFAGSSEPAAADSRDSWESQVTINYTSRYRRIPYKGPGKVPECTRNRPKAFDALRKLRR
jgi:hypothetical protein